MIEEVDQTTLNSVIERISRLENELMELRRLLLIQMPHLEQSMDKPSPFPARPDLSTLVVDGVGYWEVTFLGNFHFRCASRDIAPCNSRRGQSILKYLLASPAHAVSSEMLIECFWSQVDAAAGMHSLQVAVHALRRSLRGCGPNGGDETVLFRNNRYLLNPALSIVQDVDSFRTAYERGQRAANAHQSIEAKQAFEEARILYTGDFLADSYDEWASGHRLALQDMRLALLSQLGSLYGQGEEWELAASCYHDILAVDCYREDVYRQLMLCYAACGRPADVKRTYRACQECLRRDLRLTPAPETTALYQQLIQQPVPLDVH